MAARLCENASGHYHCTHVSQPLEISSVLLLIMLGKVSLNFFMLQVKPKNVKVSFMGYFCTSVALVDLVLLLTLSFIFYFEDFALWGMRFTKYHICLFTQIISLTYSILHFPVYLVAALDYYTTVSQTSQFPRRGQKFLYAFTVVVIWTSGVFCILKVPAVYEELEIQNSFSPDQCPLSASLQSYSVSCAMVLLLGTALLVCRKEVISMLLSVRLISFAKQPVLMFSYVSNNSSCFKWQLLSRLLICFLGTWAPFVVLQVLLLLLGLQIPAYMDMNVPWLCFINSFLIAAAYWCRCHDVELTEEAWATDPFVSWKFCFMPFNNENTEPADEPGTGIVIC
ncbi:PREDICTED: probable G-protein coupled receptor 160 [Acanthisitta chloris]|uniref:probable G-protein coupled receptor 160 n=1 Tax=Acanthisitta chloris TaxID=57068 RepID=UPI0004F0ED19|nr:PREDICTED: probable G-protein coupled receptor 160 [Acanthisitta chloris]KFP69759.1 putative G-protein coupled receptor 160 [Acanthisitta chloris]